MTATTVLDIWNLGISHLGVSVEIQSLTERSAEARACVRFYQQAHDEVLSDFPWPFAKKLAVLALVEEDPTPEWDYSYQYPVNCLSFRRILSTTDAEDTYVYTRNPILEQAVPYLISGTLLYTDWENAMGEYTQQMNDPTTFPAQFVQAIAAKMAFYMAPRLTAGDPFGLGKRAAQLYQVIIQQAEANAFNEQSPDPEPNSTFIQARDY